MKPFALFAAAACLVSTLAPAQELRHEHYTLPNGLHVILHEDHASPRVAVNLWYRVGARNEPPGRSGFAHLFEHLMFMGTKRVPDNQFDVLMETGGGANNASTSLDRTNYFSSGPSSLLPTLLWLDADRLEDMGLTMTQEKLDVQRGVVRNERRQVIEEAPYVKAYEASYQLLYPQGHPYHNGVMGTHRDLEAATVQDVKDFFATFYVPDNCSLVVAGDFDPATVKPMIEGLFGSLPRGNVAPQAAPSTPRLDKTIRVTSLDKVQLPKVAFAYHSPGQMGDGDAEMDILGRVLSDGENSRLYERLVVREQLAAEVSAFQDASALGSVFRVEVLALPDADLSRVEAVMDEELARLVREGPTSEELSQRQNVIEMTLLSSLQGLEARADRLNQYLYFWGTPDGLARDLARYRNATVASCKAWAAAVLRPDARLVQRVLPEEPTRSANGRDARPADFAAKAFNPPAPTTCTLPNGAKALVFPRTGLPLVSVEILFQPGTALDGPEEAGRSALLAEMLSQGTVNRTASEFAQAMQAAGATFGADNTQETFRVSIESLKRGLPTALGLAAEAIATPRMAPEDFDRVKSLQIENLRQADEEPRIAAAKAAMRMLLSETNPYGTPAAGVPETIDALTLDSLRAAMAAIIRPEQMTIAIAGDVTEAEARQILDATLGRWSANAPAPTPRAASFEVPDAGPGLRVGLVERPGAVQTMIMFAGPGVALRDDSRVQRRMLNTVLGGSFTSRLNQNLREKNKFTYGARSAFPMHPSTGVFTAASSVESGVTGAALREFVGELRRIASGDISADEAFKARNITLDAIGESLSTVSGISSLAIDLTAGGLPWGSVGADISAVQSLDAAALNRLAPQAIDPSKCVLVLVGDSETIREQYGQVKGELNLPDLIMIDSLARPAK